ncbi:DUF3592 domain-containing protein [Haloarcula sp. CBA1130]|uniref:DUF3592 domain-containing protein n=1 Tax=unclassified Haloarcula TaxID=2624677 RepID=UPI0012442DB5|nr:MULTISPECIES: DUF3592 domain-containing protein [unclassified Haloarcula]KAA9396167.1 DUF3592 domain-containing protein [Haloarcula sp. CBA1129]KAA9400304.1 DUF3592 domain-containing protein [Haloarcula sp. CBA1130]
MKVPLGITTLHLSQRSALLLLLAIGLLGFGGYDYVQQSQAINNGVAVQATITDAHVDRMEGGRGIDYEPEIHYTYQYQEETYTGEQVFPSTRTRTYSARSEAESVVESYEPGTTVRAYVSPADPTDAFLIRERTPWPLQAITVGGLLSVIGVLAGLGAPNPGQQELRPAREVQPAPRETGGDSHGETIHGLSKQVLGACFVGFWLSMVALVFGLLNTPGEFGGPPQEIQAELLGPVGLPMLAGFSFWVGMILSLCLYGVWSFTEYQQLRRRLPEPKAPSPFRRPSRLVTILGTENSDLSEYGQRVRLTGWAIMMAAGMTATLVHLLYTAS